MSKKSKKNGRQATTVVVVPAPAKTKKAKKSGKQPSRQRSNGGKVASLLCSLTDPFCEKAFGARLPDMSNAPSLPYTVRQVYKITPNAQGNQISVFSPNPAIPMHHATLDASGIVTSWNAVSAPAGWTAALSQGSEYRIITWGVRYMTTQAWTAAQGTQTFASTSADWTDVTDVGSMNISNDQRIVPLRDNKFAFVSEPVSMRARQYYDIAGNFNIDWTSLVLCTQGATASADCGVVEVIYNLELRPVSGSLAARVAQPPLPDSPAVLTAVSHLRDNVDSLYSEAKTSVTDMVEREAAKVASNLGESLRGVIMGALMP